MARRLDVYLYRDRVGELVQDDNGQLAFRYAERWLGGGRAVPLSQSLPLGEQTFTGRDCAAFFNGLLPEGAQREAVARRLGISARNDFAMLAEIGGECAGAVTFLPPGVDLPAESGEYRELNEPELADTLRRLPRRPLLAGDEGVRLSLAGAQGKLPVYILGSRIAIPLKGAPSTHILKPAIAEFADIVVNELACMSLAAAVGLPAASVGPGRVEDIDYLLVARYDRTAGEGGVLQRLHQEDFCQALGIVSERKYQSEGGPSIAQCVELIREACTVPARDILRFVDAIIFNYLIGNCDAHGKNYSLLYRGHPPELRVTELAPLYDLVCTSAYPDLSRRMAMKIGGEADAERIYPRHFERLAEEAKLGRRRLLRRVPELARLVQAKLPGLGCRGSVGATLVDHIGRRCARAIAAFGA